MLNTPSSNKIEKNRRDALNPFRCLLKVSRTLDYTSRSTLFSVAGYSTWDGPLQSQKKRPWNVFLGTGNFLRQKGQERRNLNLTVAVPDLCISWEMEKNGLKNGPLNYNNISQFNLYYHKMGNGLRFPMFKLLVCFFTRILPYTALTI